MFLTGDVKLQNTAFMSTLCLAFFNHSRPLVDQIETVIAGLTSAPIFTTKTGCCCRQREKETAAKPVRGAGRWRHRRAEDALLWRERLATSIWKQCDVAQSGSSKGTNVCLMWDCPGQCNCCLYKEERRREGHKKCHQTCSAAGRSCSTLALSFSFFPFFALMSQPPLFRSCRLLLLMSASSPGPWKKTHTHTNTHHHPFSCSCVFALLCLVSVSGEKRKGSGPARTPQTPQGKPESPRPKQGCSPEGPRGSLSASLIACSSLGGMCNDM